MTSNSPIVAIPPEPLTTRRLHVWLVAFVLIILSLAAYHNSFSGPFVFDDTWSIPLNPSIRQFSTALTPPNDNGQTVSGRPLLNLSFAVNYAISGKEVRSYHAVNLLIHIAAGLVLFGLVRRTLLLPALRGRFGAHSLPVAGVSAAIWLAHPLQTQSVTYIVQRAESLMALLYLLTLYCFARHVAQAAGPARESHASPATVPQKNSLGGLRCAGWLAASVLCCLLGMAAKEVMISAPLIVLLYDRALVAGTIREALARRRAYYLCLAATWILLAYLVLHNGDRGNTAGFNGKISVWTYLLTQAKAIAIYFKLTFWPQGQVFDYGTAIISDLRQVWLQALLVLALAASSIWLLVRKPVAGLAAFFVFAVLAPSSSVVPIWTEPIAEHRMYLPLAAIAAAAVALSRAWLGQRRGAHLWTCAWLAVAAVLLVLTIQRNAIYKDSLTIWRDTVQKVPDSVRANNNYANALVDEDFPLEAIKYCQRTIDLNPEFASAYNNYGYALAKIRRYDEALAYYDKCLSFREHGLEIALANRGYALYELGRHDEAIMDFQAALQIRPDYEEALNNYGNVLHTIGRSDEALHYLDKAIAISPKFASAWNNRGNVFSARGLDKEEAMRCYMRAATLDPKLWEALDNVGRYNVALGRHAEAIPWLEAAIPRAPDEAISRYRLANALMLANRQPESIPHYRRVLELRPDITGASHNLAVALVNSGSAAEAVPYFQAALQQEPGAAPIHLNYADALARLGRTDEAVAHARHALTLNPNLAWARELLSKLTGQPLPGTAASSPPLPDGG